MTSGYDEGVEYIERDLLSRTQSAASPDSAPTREATVGKLVGDVESKVVDRVAVEAPLELRFGPRLATVLMRTPGHDEDLVRGFLFTEGMIRSAADVRSLTRPGDLATHERGNVIVADFVSATPPPASERTFFSSSSCGVCGKNSIAALEVRAPRVTSSLRVKRSELGAMPARMRAAQPTFAETGGLHASALFGAQSELLAVREDVGRHNALDKLVGWALASGMVPLGEHVLLVSGRVSYEIVQKAIVAGIPVIGAVGAPSSYAVDLAHDFGVTLVGFLRPDSMNVYTSPERVIA